MNDEFDSLVNWFEYLSLEDKRWLFNYYKLNKKSKDEENKKYRFKSEPFKFW